jgi:hypothetical protein
MVRIAHIENGVVVNISVANSLQDGEIEAVGCGVGWLWDGINFSAPPAPPMTPALRTTLIKQIDVDADAIYQAVQGNRGNEYALAESDAIAFKAGGYVGAAPASVQAWADAKTATAQWAADDILATATAWRAAMSAIRTNRLRCKELARGATTSAGLEQVQTTWAGFTSAIRGQLGIA